MLVYFHIYQSIFGQRSIENLLCSSSFALNSIRACNQPEQSWNHRSHYHNPSTTFHTKYQIPAGPIYTHQGTYLTFHLDQKGKFLLCWKQVCEGFYREYRNAPKCTYQRIQIFNAFLSLVNVNTLHPTFFMNRYPQSKVFTFTNVVYQLLCKLLVNPNWKVQRMTRGEGKFKDLAYKN